MLRFLLGLGVVLGISELSKKGKLPKMADGGGVGEPYDSMTKYQLEKELRKLTDEFFEIRKLYNTTEHPKQKEIDKKRDKIITLLYGKNFSGVGQKYKYAKGGGVGKGYILRGKLKETGEIVTISTHKDFKSAQSKIDKMLKTAESDKYEEIKAKPIDSTYYAKGGGVGKVEDLFENYDKMPKNLAKIVDEYNEKFDEGEFTYEDTEEFLERVNKIGYTFDYGLDNEPFALRKIDVKLNEVKGFEEYAIGGYVPTASNNGE